MCRNSPINQRTIRRRPCRTRQRDWRNLKDKQSIRRHRTSRSVLQLQMIKDSRFKRRTAPYNPSLEQQPWSSKRIHQASKFSPRQGVKANKIARVSKYLRRNICSTNVWRFAAQIFLSVKLQIDFIGQNLQMNCTFYSFKGIK